MKNTNRSKGIIFKRLLNEIEVDLQGLLYHTDMTKLKGKIMENQIIKLWKKYDTNKYSKEILDIIKFKEGG